MDRKMSRRDWFRLRDPQKTSNENRLSVGDESQVLSPLEHPPNHDGMNLDELPPMREATLTTDQINDLFFDIAELGTDILLMNRQSSSRDRASVSVIDDKRKLEASRTALLTGKIQRLQIRYQWNQQHWIDTLERKPSGYRLVRIAHSR